MPISSDYRRTKSETARQRSDTFRSLLSSAGQVTQQPDIRPNLVNSWLKPGGQRADALRNFKDRGTGSRILWHGKTFVFYGDISYVSLKNRDVEYGRLSNDFTATDFSSTSSLLLSGARILGNSRALLDSQAH